MSDKLSEFIEKSLDTIIYPDGSRGDINYHSQKLGGDGKRYRFIVLDWQEKNEIQIIEGSNK